MDVFTNYLGNYSVLPIQILQIHTFLGPEIQICDLADLGPDPYNWIYLLNFLQNSLFTFWKFENLSRGSKKCCPNGPVP